MKQAEGLKFTKENDIRNFNKINSFNLQNEFFRASDFWQKKVLTLKA